MKCSEPLSRESHLLLENGTCLENVGTWAGLLSLQTGFEGSAACLTAWQP